MRWKDAVTRSGIRRPNAAKKSHLCAHRRGNHRLGVGASTAIFSVANAVLLRPLPYQNPDQLVIIPTDLRNRGVKDFPFSNANFIDLREATKDEFQGLAGVFT